MVLDTDYWSAFYTSDHTLRPSNFCSFVLDFMKDAEDLKVLDAGCGNGRDSYGLCHKHIVTGIDTAGYVPVSVPRCSFETADFCSYDKTPFDLIYSRFTFHSITDEQQIEFLESIKRSKTRLAIECRSNLGEKEACVHGKNHFRNFVDYQRLLQQLVELNFRCVYAEEATGFAPYKTENPVCIRIIAEKI